MKKIVWLFLVLSFAVFGQNYKQVKIYLTAAADIRTLASFDLSLDHFTRTKDNAIITFLNDAEFNRLTLLNYRYEVLIDDWYAYYNKRSQMTPVEKQRALEKSKTQFGVKNFGFGSMGGYYTYDEILQKLDEMKSLYPNLITAKIEIGATNEGRSMYAVKISDNPDVDETEPQVLYTALTHAREPEGMMQQLYFMYYLLENYGTDAEVTYLVDNRELYFIPIINPDGYVYNQTLSASGGGMWRKNRKNNNGSYGVDLNRNFGPNKYWNAPNGGSSLNPNDETYRGTAPFSEPETNSIYNFLTTKKITNALNYHSYGNDLIFPYGAMGTETPDSLIFREFAEDMTKYNHYVTGTDLSTVGYSTRGNSDDFMYDGYPTEIGKIFAMTPEVGNGNDGFWPLQQRILPIAEENLFPNLYYAWTAGGYPSLASYSFNKEVFQPGDTVRFIPVIKNKGLVDISNVALTFASVDALANVKSSDRIIADVLPSRGKLSIDSGFVFVLNPNLKNGDEAKFLFSTFMGNVPAAQDTVSLTVGTANIVFKDTSVSPVTNWNITSNTSKQWGTTTSSYASASSSFSDSPSGNYLSNATVVMTLKDSINLASISNPRLSFWTKFDIENDWDCGIVEISSDGGKTWKAVGGKYANGAAGQGRQLPQNSPVYDGLRAAWVKEEIDLTAFARKSLKIRFSLLSDEAVEKDGWYLDDISVVTYDPLTSIDNEKLQPMNFSLEQNYPNPFNPETSIRYEVSANCNVTLKIFSVLGDEITTLVNDVKAPGKYQVVFNGATLASGIYFYQLRSGNFVETKKMVLVK